MDDIKLAMLGNREAADGCGGAGAVSILLEGRCNARR